MQDPALVEYQQRLHKDFPNLNISKIKILSQGWVFTALEINDSIVFRLIKEVDEEYALVANTLYEIEVLRHLQSKISVDIPHPIYIAPDKTYFGYPKLSGELVVNILPAFNKKDVLQLQKDWVKIAADIHNGIALSLAKKLSIPLFDPQQTIKTAKRILDFEDQGITIKNFAHRTLQKVSKIEIKNKPLSFIHNDLHLLNILGSAETKRITGVIDWSDCHIAPLSREFAVWEWSHDDSLEQIAKLYETQTGIHVNIQEAKIWKHIEEISDLVEQIESGDRKGLRDSLNHIERWVAGGN